MVIGQRTFTAQAEGASDTLVGAVSGLAYANNTLFVVDSNRVGAAPINNRVLIFNNVGENLPSPAAELQDLQRCNVCTGQANLVLGQPDFSQTEIRLSQSGLRQPTSVATDGQYLAVADTDNNRVLIWNHIPTVSNAPANVVVGQSEFNANGIPPNNVPNNKSMRGPQGVWIQNGKLFVADTQNHRVLIYNSIPTTNGKEADVVLGQPDFNTFVQPDLTQSEVNAKATNLLNPVGVTSDGQRLYVTDLGHNRVLVWNTIPAQNQQAADFALGQPDVTSSLANNSKALCEPLGQDADGNNLYPRRCNATLDFPRYALAAGGRLFVADGGNDRVLVYNQIPSQSGQAANYVIGQLGGLINQASDSADSLRTPMSLAWDGTNLYVSDSYNRRVMVYSPAEVSIPYTGVRNAASREIFAIGAISFDGEVKENDEVIIKITGKDDVEKEYKYKIVKDNTFQNVAESLVEAINAGAGDPNAFASANPGVNGIVLTARAPGSDGDEVEFSVTTSASATILATTSGATLSGGQDAAKIAPGTLVSIVGDNLSEETETAPGNTEGLPTKLAGVQVYFDGIPAPLLYVSPSQINAQIPFHVLDATSVNAYVRTERKDGSVTVTTPVAVSIVPENPGIFAFDGRDPRPGVVLHATSNASGTVSVDGSVKAGDVATVAIEDREYTYTVQEGDTLASIRDNLINLINQDEKVTASAAGVFTRIRLRAKIEGPEGNGIAYSARVNEGAQVILTPTGSGLCCANVANSLVTEENPAVPGETIIIYATGLGITEPNSDIVTGHRYRGPVNEPREFVSSLAGGKTANVLLATLKEGEVGLYEVHLELNSDIPTNPATQLTIAQFTFVSNIVTFPVVNPNPPEGEGEGQE